MANNIEKIKVGTTTSIVGIPIITCTTAAATKEKTVTAVSWLGSLDDLKAGVEIKLLLTYGNTNASPTLNLNSLGAKNIVGYGGCALANFSTANSIMSLTYDGTNWIIG